MSFFTLATRAGHRIFLDNAGQPFWMRGVFNCDLTTLPPGTTPQMLWSPWGGEAQWGVSVAHRLKKWGFNTAGEYASAYVRPVDQFATRNMTDPIPTVNLVRPGFYSLTNNGGYAHAPVANLIGGLGAAYTGYRGDPICDIFDPNFIAYTNGYVASVTKPAVAANEWIIGTAIADGEDVWGWGPGPDQPTIPAGKACPHLGMMVLMAVNPTGTPYATKTEFVNNLTAKYVTVAALNAAWGANYNLWSDVLAENGSGWPKVDQTTLAGATDAMKADLDNFLLRYALNYCQIVAAALRAVQPGHLVFGPATLNGWNGLSRPQVLGAVSEACDVVQASLPSDAVYDATVAACGPMATFVGWLGATANADSTNFAGKPDSLGNPVKLATQRQRGEWLRGEIERYQLYPQCAGFKWWAWMDSWGEQQNWGLVDFQEQPYIDFLARIR